MIRLPALALLVLLTACGTPVELAEPGPSPSPDELVPDCADVAELQPLDEQPPASEGAPGNPDELAGEVRQWAETEAGDSYAGMWLDNGRLVVAFAHDVARYGAELRERFGGVTAVAEAEHTYAELQEAQEAITAWIGEERDGAQINSWGTYETRNRMGVGVLGDAEELRRELTEEFGADLVCLDVEPIPGEERAEVASWEPAPGVDLSPEATEIDLVVVERGCASGRPADGRIAEPEISYGDETVTVTIRVIPQGGPQNCPSNPPTPYTLTLDEPLGDRELLDGGQDPPGPPQADH